MLHRFEDREAEILFVPLTWAILGYLVNCHLHGSAL